MNIKRKQNYKKRLITGNTHNERLTNVLKRAEQARLE